MARKALKAVAGSLVATWALPVAQADFALVKKAVAAENLPRKGVTTLVNEVLPVLTSGEVTGAYSRRSER